MGEAAVINEIRNEIKRDWIVIESDNTPNWRTLLSNNLNKIEKILDENKDVKDVVRFRRNLFMWRFGKESPKDEYRIITLAVPKRTLGSKESLQDFELRLKEAIRKYTFDVLLNINLQTYSNGRVEGNMTSKLEYWRDNTSEYIIQVRAVLNKNPPPPPPPARKRLGRNPPPPPPPARKRLGRNPPPPPTPARKRLGQ